MFKGIDFLIYSSHKSGTQTLLNTLQKKYRGFMVHTIKNFNHIFRPYNINTECFKSSLKTYKEETGHRLKVYTIIRNNDERLISSFFQTCHDDIIIDYRVPEKETIIMKKSVDELVEMFCTTKSEMPYYRESLDELQEILGNQLPELIDLVILDFEKLFDLVYLNEQLGTQLEELVIENRTRDKIYHSKFLEFKAKLN